MKRLRLWLVCLAAGAVWLAPPAWALELKGKEAQGNGQKNAVLGRTAGSAVMRKLQVEIPEKLWDALSLYSERNRTSINEAVDRALSDLLAGGAVRRGRGGAAPDIDDDDTVFQASTTTALVQGVYRG